VPRPLAALDTVKPPAVAFGDEKHRSGSGIKHARTLSSTIYGELERASAIYGELEDIHYRMVAPACSEREGMHAVTERACRQ
jgi:hypothetical protein